MKSTNIQIISIILAACLLSALYLIFKPGESASIFRDVKIGQVAERDIIAPFSYTVYKDAAQLEAERNAAIQSVKLIYRIDERTNFDILKKLDSVFVRLNELFNEKRSSEEIQTTLAEEGFALSIDSIEYLKTQLNRSSMMNFLTNHIHRTLKIGIYPDDYPEESISLLRNNEIKSYTLRKLYSLSEAKEKITQKIRNMVQQRTVVELLDQVLTQNIVEDQKTTEKKRQEAADEVSNVIAQVLKNEKIISKNQRITEDDYRKLIAMPSDPGTADSAKNLSAYSSTLGIFIFNLFIMFSFYLILKTYFPQDMKSTTRLLILIASILITILLTIILKRYAHLNELLVPMAFGPLFVATIFNPNIAFIYNFYQMVFVAEFNGWQFIHPLTMTLAILGALLALKKVRTKFALPVLFFNLAIPFVIIASGSFMIRSSDWEQLAKQILYGSISALISVLMVVFITPFIQRRLKMATRQVLLDLLDFNNPLLKKLAEKAPGTYSHSLIVGNLAESAADAIGANSLLARVGSYYHDIGKIDNPRIFIENNSRSGEIHDSMEAEESATQIREHVANGMTMAKRHALPTAVIDIIKQHHGTSHIRYFLDKARKTNPTVDEKKFTYYGPLPQSKEAALVMIADIVESTTKSLKSPTGEAIKKTLDDTIVRLIRDDQLKDAPITLKELETVKSYMLPILKGVYSMRIEYPEDDED